MKQTGRPPNAIKELCRRLVFNDKLIERLSAIATNDEEQTRDQIRAIEVLLDRGFGKAEQSLDITQHDEARPSTDVLIQTISALRAELDSIGKGIKVETKE